MAHYLVRAEPKDGRMAELSEKLADRAFANMQPFGPALTAGLVGARLLDDGRAVWEEEDYCSPPLAMEREAVLDHYFRAIEVQKVRKGEGWQQIQALPRLFEVNDKLNDSVNDNVAARDKAGMNGRS